jgi:hypothetical protein
MKHTMRDLTADELESVSGGDGVGGIPGGILTVGQGMYEMFAGWGEPSSTQNTTASMPLCGGATWHQACLLP